MNSKEIIRALKKLGWIEARRTRGDHIKMINGLGATTVIPSRGSRQLAHGTISAICKQTGIDKDVLSKYC